MNFSDAQKRFLRNEMGINESDYLGMSRTDWEDVRMKCFDIEVDEVMAAEEGKIAVSERGNMAVNLIDYIYDVVMPNLKRVQSAL